ncbi:MAG: uncharacterized protein KVP18_002807 [Porospora cf. gigantea A]|uniref:uncharacterized protein n=1 Tax=Porospora cf. gigantea A TaxID=2853593 RepID=UPI003559FA31|nr:MAG: hypothetical protein KVP18_002807 [Porospora cf. gigantea A]
MSIRIRPEIASDVHLVGAGRPPPMQEALAGVLLGCSSSVTSHTRRLEEAKLNESPIDTNIAGVDLKVFLKPCSSGYRKKLWKTISTSKYVYVPCPYPERDAIMVLQVPKRRAADINRVRMHLQHLRATDTRIDLSLRSKEVLVSTQGLNSQSSAKSLIMSDISVNSLDGVKASKTVKSSKSIRVHSTPRKQSITRVSDGTVDRLQERVDQLADKNQDLAEQVQYMKGRLDAHPARSPRSARSSQRSGHHELNELKEQLERLADRQNIVATRRGADRPESDHECAATCCGCDGGCPAPYPAAPYPGAAYPGAAYAAAPYPGAAYAAAPYPGAAYAAAPFPEGAPSPLPAGDPADVPAVPSPNMDCVHYHKM